MYRIAFVGNPNVGKSTWINYLTGSNLKVANYLGVSVEASVVDYIHGNKQLEFIDLPGIYDLHHVSAEEVYTKQYLEDHNIDVIVNVIDYRDIKRQLHLTNQLKQLGIKMVVLLNFLPQEISSKKIESFSNYLKLPIIYSGFIQKDNIIDIFLSNKMSNTDIINERNFDALKLSKSKKDYDLDAYLLHPTFGIVYMILILVISITLLYQLSIPIAMGIEILIDSIYTSIIEYVSIPLYLESILLLFYTLLQSIFAFIPFLFFIFIFLAVIEESGYVARIAYLMDPFMSMFHLSGKSVIPLFIGFGCNVPAIMATRMLDNKKERIACALMIPFISCSAKLPIFLLFTSVFFSDFSIFVIFFLYGLSLLVSLFVGSVVNLYHHEIFVIELPSYQMPKLDIVLKKSIQEIILFTRKVILVLLVSILCIYIIQFIFNEFHLSLFFIPLGYMENDIIRSSTIYGLISKENLLFYFSNLTQGNDMSIFLYSLFSKPLIRLKVLCYLMYVAMNIPCVMTLIAIKKEFGNKVLTTSILLMLFVPYVLTFIVFHVLSFIY